MAPTNQETVHTDRRLHHDSIYLSGKTIFLNPFLYWRRFDSNTDRWLREPGQLSEEQIQVNRGRFYPEIDWDHLGEEERVIKDAAVEMFLKSLDLITTFHPDLSSGQLLEIERKMAVTKKRAFERWVEKSFKRRFRKENFEKKRLKRERFFREWREWLSFETTHKAAAPFAALVILVFVGGWSMGMSSNICEPFFSNADQNSMK